MPDELVVPPCKLRYRLPRFEQGVLEDEANGISEQHFRAEAIDTPVAG